MADNNFLDLKVAISDKASEVYKYQSIEAPLNVTSDRKYFLNLFDSEKEAFDKCTEDFNKLLSMNVTAFESLISYSYAEYYLRASYNSVKAIDYLFKLLEEINSEYFEAILSEISLNINFINEEIRKIFELNSNTIDKVIPEENMKNLLVYFDNISKRDSTGTYYYLEKSLDIVYEDCKKYLLNGEREFDFSNLEVLSSGSNEELIQKNKEMNEKAFLKYFTIILNKDNYSLNKLLRLINDNRNKIDFSFLHTLNDTSKVLYERLNSLYDSKENFLNGLFNIISAAGQSILDHLYSWYYMEDCRTSKDSFYNADYISEFRASIDELIEDINNFLSFADTNDMSTEAKKYKNKMISGIQAGIQETRIQVINIVSIIEQIKKEEENYTPIFKFTGDYGNAIDNMMKTIEEIFLSEVSQVENSDDISISTNSSNIFDSATEIANFKGSEFIIPYFYNKGNDSEVQVNNFTNSYANWKDSYNNALSVKDQTTNTLLLYLGTYFNIYLKAISQKEEEFEKSLENPYAVMRNIAIKSILDKSLYVYSKNGDTSDLSNEDQYGYYRAEEKRLSELYSLEFSSNFESEQIATEFVVLFSGLNSLSYIKVDRKLISDTLNFSQLTDDEKISLQNQFKNIKYLILKAILSSDNYNEKIERLLKCLNNNKFESIKSFYFKRFLLEVIGLINGETKTLENNSFESVDGIMRNYLKIYNAIYAEDSDILSFLERTKIHDFITGIESSTKDNIQTIKANIGGKVKSLFDMMAISDKTKLSKLFGTFGIFTSEIKEEISAEEVITFLAKAVKKSISTLRSVIKNRIDLSF